MTHKLEEEYGITVEQLRKWLANFDGEDLITIANQHGSITMADLIKVEHVNDVVALHFKHVNLIDEESGDGLCPICGSDNLIKKWDMLLMCLNCGVKF